MYWHFSMALPDHSEPRPLIQFHNHFSQTVELLGQMISPSQCRYLSTRQHKHRINAYTYQTFMSWVGIEPTIPASKRAKTFHVLDRAAAVTGKMCWISGSYEEFKVINTTPTIQLEGEVYKCVNGFSVGQNASWKGSSRSNCSKYSTPIMELSISTYFYINKSPSQKPILSNLNPGHTRNLLKIHVLFNIMYPFMPKSL
jgi:hypothetical protein